MKCVICKTGETGVGQTEVVLRHKGATVIVRDVPAEVCDSCGEGYFSEDVSRQLERIADEAFQPGVEVQIIRWPGASDGGASKSSPEGQQRVA